MEAMMGFTNSIGGNRCVVLANAVRWTALARLQASQKEEADVG